MSSDEGSFKNAPVSRSDYEENKELNDSKSSFDPQ